MPVNLPLLMQQAGEVPQQAQPWIWLCELEVVRRSATLPAVLLRMTSSDQVVEWPPAATAPPRLSWYPMAFGHSEIDSSQQGDLPSVDLTIDNTARTLMRYLHSGDGFEGNRATLFLVHGSSITSPAYPAHQYQRWDFVIAAASATDAAVVLRLEQPNLFEDRLPADRFVAQRCRWRFGGPECGYPITPAAAFTTCDKSLLACIARGADEADRRLPVLHPRRYGGFPGIPVQRSRGAV